MITLYFITAIPRFNNIVSNFGGFGVIVDNFFQNSTFLNKDML